MKTLLLLPFLAGCALFSSPQDMTAAQIKASVADKNINVICTVIPTPWGVAKTNVLSVDETSQTNATTSMKGDCSELSVTTVKPFPPPKDAPTKPAP